MATGRAFEADIHPLLEAHDMIAMVTGRLHILFTKLVRRLWLLHIGGDIFLISLVSGLLLRLQVLAIELNFVSLLLLLSKQVSAVDRTHCGVIVFRR